MIQKVFSVYDGKAEAFLRPYFAPTRGLAVRAFSDAVNDPQHEFNKHAEDYSLFEVGEFDEKTGVLSSSITGLGLAITFRRSD